MILADALAVDTSVASLIAIAVSVLTILGITWRAGSAAARSRDDVAGVVEDLRSTVAAKEAKHAKLEAHDAYLDREISWAVLVVVAALVVLAALAMRNAERLRTHEIWARESLERLGR